MSIENQFERLASDPSSFSPVIAAAQKAAQLALAEKAQLAEQLTNVAASAPGVVFSFRIGVDGKFSYPYTSPNVKEVLGLDFEDTAQDAQRLRERIRTDDIYEFDAGIAQSARRMEVWKAEFRYRHPAKGEIWLETTAIPARQGDGAIVWHGYAHDVTANRRAEEARARSEARLRAVVEGAMDAIITIDQQGTIQSINNAGLYMFGYAGEEVRGCNVSMLMPEQLWRAHAASIGSCQETGSAKVIGGGRDIFGRRKDGSLFPMELAVTRTKCDDGPLFVGFARDITERRKIEARVERLHQERLAAMSGMVAALAHEINQPMAATTNYLCVARRVLEMQGAPRSANVAATLDKAVEQVLRAGDIIRSLHKFVALGEPDKTHLRLHALVAEVYEKMQASACEANVRATLSLNATDDCVLADAIQIKQVLINLIRNAIEAMHGAEGAELAISTSSFGDDAIRVDVADTRRGRAQPMDKESFDPFAAKIEGMDVGLSISRLVIEAHGGKIWGSPNAQGGSVFSFSLALAGVVSK